MSLICERMAVLACDHMARLTLVCASDMWRSHPRPRDSASAASVARAVNVAALGAGDLFTGDVHGGERAFEPLWRALALEVRCACA